MLLTQDDLLGRLQGHLDEVERVDIAVAWASPGDALSLVLGFGRAARDSLRSIVGISGNATYPAALRKLQRHGKLRVVLDGTPLFHPKLFLFHGQKGTMGWIGSANLTRPGFQQNTELVWQFHDDGTASQWFNELWKKLDDDPSKTIAEYERRWKPTTPPPRAPILAEGPSSDKEFRRLASGLSDWPSFVRGLKAANPYWMAQKNPYSVDGECNSWLNTITLGNEIMRRSSWDRLTKNDYRLIMGIETKIDGIGTGYGLLGSMKGAGFAKEVFNRSSATDLRKRERIRTALQPVLGASQNEFPDIAVEFIRSVQEIKGFSGGVATRFLALARPDLAVSVNDAAEEALAELSGLPRTSLNKAPSGPKAKSYADLLRWLAHMPWYSNPSPHGTYERTLAKSRAALLDCLVYRP